MKINREILSLIDRSIRAAQQLSTVNVLSEEYVDEQRILSCFFFLPFTRIFTRRRNKKAKNAQEASNDADRLKNRRLHLNRGSVAEK